MSLTSPLLMGFQILFELMHAFFFLINVDLMAFSSFINKYLGQILNSHLKPVNLRQHCILKMFYSLSSFHLTSIYKTTWEKIFSQNCLTKLKFQLIICNSLAEYVTVFQNPGRKQMPLPIHFHPPLQLLGVVLILPAGFQTALKLTLKFP